MSGFHPGYALLSCLLAFAAAILAAFWIRPAWDAFAQKRIEDVTPRLRALGLDEEQVSVWLRWWGVAMFGTFFLIGVIMQMFPVALGALLVIFVAPRFMLDRMIESRQIKLRDQLVRACVGVANACRAGLSLPQGIEKVAEDTPAPLKSELKRIVRDYKAGRPLQQAIREVQKRLDLESFSIFASSINVSLEKGGNVTFALERISSGLQEMQRLERKLEADSASGRRLATVLALFPIGFLILFTVLDPVATGRLYNTLIGNIVLLVIGGIVYFSARWCASILDLDF